MAWIIPGQIDYDLGKKQFEGPCEDHFLGIKGPYFGHFYEKGLCDTPRIVKFGMEHPWA